MKTISYPAIITILAVTLMSGCASVSVTKIQSSNSQGFVPPKKILIQQFTASDSALKVDRQGAALQELKSKMATQLAGDVAKSLSENVLPAEPLASNSRPPREDAWLVTGSFLRVNQGSRALRSIVGFGAGGTRIETSVIVYALNGPKPSEVLRFRTFGGSNQEPGPGIVMGAIPMNLGAPFSLVYGPTMTGLSFDIHRTAKEISAEIADFLRSRGCKIKNSNLKVKLLKDMSRLTNSL
jgi:Domain of unknown function (DUF4410)